MFIIRWILSHPIIAIWSLSALVMILNFSTGKPDISSGHDTVAEASHKTEQNPVDGKVKDQKEDLVANGKNANAHANIQASVSPASLSEATTKADDAVITSGAEESKTKATEEVSASEKPEAPAASEQSTPATEATTKADVVITSDAEESKAGEAKAEVSVGPEKPEAPTTPEQSIPATEATTKTDDAAITSGGEESKTEEATEEVPVAPEKAEATKPEALAIGQSAVESKAELSTSEVVSAVTQLKAGGTTARGQAANVGGGLLNKARAAYWNNNLEQSVSLYKALIAKDSNNINYKGELANVFWRMKQPKEAAKIYSEIALPMIEAGRSAEVENMLGFIGRYFPEEAKEILMQMTRD